MAKILIDYDDEHSANKIQLEGDMFDLMFAFEEIFKSLIENSFELQIIVNALVLAIDNFGDDKDDEDAD